VDKVVLAYSGGLDTSCCIKWLKDKYNLDVICFSAFIGEVSDKKALELKAIRAGASKVYVEDLKQEFAEEYIMPALWAHARYEGQYPLATSLGRPLIAKHLVRVAHKEGAKYVAHGCTGKGNDQVRIELGVRTLDPKLKIIAPLREWEFKSREEEIEYAKKNNIAIPVTKASPYSIDKNIWGVAIEAGILENPWTECPEDAFIMTKGGMKPRKTETVQIGFERGVPKTVNGKKKKLVELIDTLNTIAGRHGIGRMDMIENRLVGIKSREIYEAPAAELLLRAHEDLEAMVLDREILHFKRLLSDKFAELAYNGQWFSNLKQALDAFFAKHQERVTGTVKFKLDRGVAHLVGRKAKKALYSEKLATYSADDIFDHAAAAGFIKLWGLPYEGTAKDILKKKSRRK